MSDLAEAIIKNQAEFGVKLNAMQISRLVEFYEIINTHNDLLHLVAPCTAEVFAARHILESLTLLEYLPNKAIFADVGAGAGLPSIPCLLVREDLRGYLIETSEKKSAFLREAIENLHLEDRAEIINSRFEDTPQLDLDCVTSRALDKFDKKLRDLVKFAGKKDLVLFGGNNLRENLRKLNLKFTEKLTPQSEQRFIFHVKK